MPITDILEKNCRLYGDDVCLVEINPEMPETKRSTWKEYDLIEPSRAPYYRREITWNVFNEKANRFAKSASGTRSPKRGQGRNPFDELFWSGADLFWYSENGSFGSTAELPLFSR